MTENSKSKKTHKKSARKKPDEIASGLIVFRRTDEGLRFLLLYHGKSYWNFPKGKLEQEEKSLDAALRELEEETGLKSRDLNLIKNFKAYERFSFYRNKKVINKLVILYLAETRRKRIRISDEHSGFGWFPFSETKQILAKYKENLTIITNANSFLQRRFQKKPTKKVATKKTSR